MIILLALAGAFFNAFIRGGAIKHWFPKFQGGDILNAAAFGGVAGYLSDTCIGLLCALAMFVGSMPALFKEGTDTAVQEGNWLVWSAIVCARGFIWILPVALVLAPFYGMAALWFLLPGILMPAAYNFVWWHHKSNGFIHAWSLSEMAFGAMLWACLIIV